MKYSKKELAELRKLRKNGWTYAEIGEVLGVTRQAAHFAINRKRKKREKSKKFIPSKYKSEYYPFSKRKIGNERTS